MENILLYLLSNHNTDYLKNQKILKKYQTWLEECDFKESINVYKKGTELFGETNTICSHLTLFYKEDAFLPVSNDPMFCNYLSSKNRQSLMPLINIPLKVSTDNLTQHERDQGYEPLPHIGDGIVGLFFDKPLESDLKITFYLPDLDWKESYTLPRGTFYYKLPQIIFTFWFLQNRMLIQGIIPGTTLVGTIISLDDRNVLVSTLEMKRLKHY